MKHDGVALVLKVLRIYNESRAVLFSGFRVIKCIANGALGRAAVLKAGCLEIILAALENCIEGRDMISLRLHQARPLHSFITVHDSLQHILCPRLRLFLTVECMYT